jgi:sortase A
MDKAKSSRGKFSLVLCTLSIGALVLGIGLIVWAAMSIGAESVPAEAYSDLPSSGTTVAVNHAGSAGNQAAPYHVDANRSPSSAPTTVATSQVESTVGQVDPDPAEAYRDLPSSSTTVATSQVESTVGQADPAPAEAYSDLPSSSTTVAVSQIKLSASQAAPYPKEGEKIGSLSIPVLKQKWPIVEGTGTNELKKGVGHFIQSVLPGGEDNCVLSGHRTTVFAKLGKLKIGDQLIVQTAAGTYTYEIARIRIVHKDDRTVIVHTDHAVLTLTTCYPFVYVGSAPDRYIVSADLVARQ